jgi:hypothetical protein
VASECRSVLKKAAAATAFKRPSVWCDDDWMEETGPPAFELATFAVFGQVAFFYGSNGVAAESHVDCSVFLLMALLAACVLDRAGPA